MKLNRFLINSDYSAEKQSHSFTITLPSGSLTVAAGGTTRRYVDITVPSGVYFENVVWTTSLTGSRRYVGPFLEFEPTSMLYTVVFTVEQTSNTNYRLSGWVTNWDSSSHTYTFSASAKVNLSISPFS